MFIAILAAAIATALAIAAEKMLWRYLRQDAVNAWLANHLYFPLLRTLVLVAFVLSAYPELFGQHELPPLAELLRGEQAWFSQAINVLFVAALAAPLLPVIGCIPGAVLPVQGVAMTALLYSWLTKALNLPFAPWPEPGTVVFMLAVAAGAPVLAAQALRRSPVAPHETFLPELIVLLAQVPLLLAYGHALGEKLPGT